VRALRRLLRPRLLGARRRDRDEGRSTPPELARPGGLPRAAGRPRPPLLRAAPVDVSGREHGEGLPGVPGGGGRAGGGGGSSGAVGGVAELADGRTVFAKLGDVPDPAAAIRAECAIYPRLSGPFVPRLVAADASVPVLVIEDLSDATWPPPWTPAAL